MVTQSCTRKMDLSEHLLSLAQLSHLCQYHIFGKHGVGLSNVPEQPEYSDFIAYFERTWISGVFPLKIWNHYDNAGPRTIHFYQRSRHVGNRHFGTVDIMGIDILA